MPDYPTYFFTRPFAESGDKTLLSDTSVSTGRANLPEGFPEITATPIAKGGIAPNRLDFNGAFYGLSLHTAWQQSGGMYKYNSELDYEPPAIVYYSGQYWQCVQSVSADSTVTPGSDSDYWIPLLEKLNEDNVYPVTLTGDVTGSSSAGSDGLTVATTATQAAKWTNARTITFTGDVTGSITLDGSSDVSVEITVNDTGDSTPVGTVIMYYGSTAPDGYFICNGGTFSSSTYPELYALLGSTTLPDLRNQFIRGASPGSREVGYSETDAGREITGTIPGEKSTNTYWNAVSGAFYMASATNNTKGSGDNDSDNTQISFAASKSWGSSHTASEFRPANVALLFCIKHD